MVNLDLCLVNYDNYNTVFSHGTGKVFYPKRGGEKPVTGSDSGLCGVVHSLGSAFALACFHAGGHLLLETG